MDSDKQKQIAETEKQGTSPNLVAKPNAPPPVAYNTASKQPEKKHLERYRFLVEILTLIVVGFYTYFAWQQSIEMRKATEATKKSADAAIIASDIAKKTLDQNKTVLDTTIKQFELEQRAWMSPTFAATPLEEGKPFKIITTITNSGKTFAKNIKVYVASAYIGPDVPPDCSDTFFKKHFVQTSMVIFPNQAISITEDRPVVIKEVLDSLQSKRKKFYLRGLITYNDIFQQIRFSQFCSYFAPELNNFAPCKTCNDAK